MIVSIPDISILPYFGSSVVDSLLIVTPFVCRERSGSVVECLTQYREAMGSSLTGVTALWPLSKTHLS